MSAAAIVDVVLGVFVVESVALLLLLRGRRFARLAPTLAAGFFLVLALRSAVRGDAVFWIGLLVGLGGLAHAIDLRLRLRSQA